MPGMTRMPGMWRAISSHRTCQASWPSRRLAAGTARLGRAPSVAAGRRPGVPTWVWHRPLAAGPLPFSLDGFLVWTEARRSRRRRVVWPMRLRGPGLSLIATYGHGMEVVVESRPL